MSNTCVICGKPSDVYRYCRACQKQLNEDKIKRILFRNDKGGLNVICPRYSGGWYILYSKPKKNFKTLSGAIKYMEKQGYKEDYREYKPAENAEDND